MLAFFLGLLKIIGIILLIIILVILLLAGVVLLVPIKYCGEGLLTDEKKQVKARITWLCKLVRVKLDYSFPDKPLVSVKILCFELMKKKEKAQKKEKKPKESKKSGETKAKREKNKKKEKYHPAVNSALLEAAEAEEALKIEKETNKIETNVPAKNSETIKGNNETEKQDEAGNKIEKIIFKIQGLCDKIKHIIDNINYYLDILEEENTQNLLKDAWKSILKILKSIKPKVFKLNVLFGFDTPDTTGRVYGYYCMMMPWLCDDISVEADFEQKVINADFYMKGKITILTIVVNGLRIVFDKRLKPVIDKIKNGGKNNE